MAKKMGQETHPITEAIAISENLSSENKGLLLNTLASLEGELQARDITLSVLKGECVKNLMTQTESPPDHTYKTDPVFALLRDSMVAKAKENRIANKHHQHQQGESFEMFLIKQQLSLAKHKHALKKALSCLKESESLRESAQSELEFLRAKALENENQKEAKEASEGDEESGQKDKSAEESDAEGEGESKRSEEIKHLEEQLQEEKRSKMQLVLLLVNDRKQFAMRYLQEKRRNETLLRVIKEEKAKAQSLAIELEEESKRSLALEADMEHYLRQIKDLQDENKKLLLEERRKNHDLEEALRRSKQEADHLRKQLAEAHRVAMSQASVVSNSLTLPSQTNLNYTSKSSSSGDMIGFSSLQQPPEPILATAGSGSLGKTTQGGKTKMSVIKDLTADPSDSGDSVYLRQARVNRGKNDHVSTTSATASVSSLSSSSATVLTSSATAKKGSKSSVPPPIPPNKPSIVRNAMIPGSNTISYSTTQQQQPASTRGLIESTKLRFLNE